MKKIFTLFFALFMMVFCAKAQYLLQEGFETSTLPTGWTLIDNDNDGYNWFPTLSATENYSYHSGSGCITSASWDSDAGALTPDNWLITPAINLTSNATLTFWVVGQDPSYAAENYSVYVATSNTVAAFTATTPVLTGTSTDTYTQQTVNLSAYTGQTVYIAFRHHNVTDMFMLNIDDVEIFAQPTSPTISAAPATIDFGTVGMPGSKIESTIISAYSLTADITATTAAPFEVSANGTTYGTTATIAQAGGTLYVKYTPTAAGTDNGTVTLASTGATNVTITLTGSALDCSNNPLPYTTDFTNEAMNNCWTIVDANNDGNTFTFNESGYVSYYYDANNNANDWLISPVFQLGANATASFDYAVGGSSYPEKYSVYVIANGQTYANANQVVATQQVTNTSWETQYIDLSAYANQSIQIGIKCESDADMYLFGVTNFFIGEDIPTTVIVNRTSIDFGTIPAGTSTDAMVIISSTNLNEAIDITTSAPYEISLDRTTYSTTVTIPANSALAVDDTVYVQFAPSAAGNYSNIVTISTTSTNDTIALTGVSVECNTIITTFPFTEDFEETSTTRTCWTINDANNDGRTFSFYNGAARCQYHSTNPADDWLISPEMTLTGSQIATFDYWEGSSNYGAERFQVFAINSNGAIALTGEINVNNTTAESQIVDLSSLTGNYRIGIHCISPENIFFLYIDNFVVSEVSTASLSVAPATMDFSAVVGTASTAQIANVSGLALTDAISITAPANFEVSTDNITYGASATIAVSSSISTQATLYVRYNPTAAGNHTGNITLTSGSVSATIALTGSAIDCSGAATLPFTEDFEGELSECWLNIDNDADGYSWGAILGSDEKPAHSGDYSYASASYINNLGALTPDNWLITPAISIPANGAMLSWWVAAQDPNYPSDHYEVMISTTGTATTDFTSVYEETISSGDWTQRTVALPAYANQTIHIAFVHNECTDLFLMKIDDISVTELSADPTIEVNPTSVAFGNLVTPNTDVATVNVTAYNLTADIAISTAAPYTVSTDGINYNTTATMTQSGGVLYIQYAPIAAGSYNGMVNLTSGTANATITLTGTATEPADCNTPASLPFIEGFEGEDVPDCWTTIDADGDGHDWYVLNNSQSSQGGFVVHSGEGHITSASYASGALTPDNWLITPQIAMGTNGHLSFWAAGQDPSYAAEVFSVYLSTTGPATTDFTVTLLDHQTTTGTMTEYTADLSAYAGQNIYIAFRHHDVTDMFRLNLDDVSITGETSIADVESNNVSVYPNPANNVINVNANSNISNVEVFTIAGQKVGDFTANSTNTAISTANLTNGLYMMKIHTENGVINKKFSVVR